MSKHIVEDLPARKFAPAAPAAKKESGGKGKTEQNSEERISQAASDIRYRARRENIDLKQAFAQYMQNSSMSPGEKAAVKAKLFGKGGMNEDYTSGSHEWASDSVAKALFKVFVGGDDDTEIHNDYLEELANSPERKYKVRVRDKKTGRTYVRYATREKITQLRANPNIESVEMTEYGEPYEGERRRGRSTARATAGKGLDPVGKEDADVDNDGKPNDKNDKYIMKRRAAIGRAMMNRASTRTEEFLADGTDSFEGGNAQKITGKNVDNSRLVKVFPNDGSDPQMSRGPVMQATGTISAGTELQGDLIAESAYSKFMTMLNEKAVSEQQQKLFGLALSVKRGETPRSEVSDEVLKIVDKMSEKEIRKYAKTSHEGLPEKKEMKEEHQGPGSCSNSDSKDDKRDQYAKINLIKNKLRAMGAKNPIVMSTEEREFDEPGEEDWRPEVRSHNKKYGGYKPGKKRPSGGGGGSGPVKPA